MHGRNVDEKLSSSDNESSNHREKTESSGRNEEGIFDDVEDDNDDTLWNFQKNHNHRKRKLTSASEYFSNLQRAIKRRQQKRDKLNRLLDPEQFDDTEDFVPHSGPLLLSRSSALREKEIQKKVTPESPDAKADTSKTLEKSKPADSPSSLRREKAKDENKTDTDVSRHGGRDLQTKDDTITSSNYFKFDERKFFSMPTFQPQVKEEAFRKIYAALEAPLKTLEQDGYEAYRQYIECDDDDNTGDSTGRFHKFHTKHSQRERERKQEESIRNSLRNAIVNGDPREYQRKIFEVAKKRNTIVNLGTGAGKTLIALLLIREVWYAQEKEGKEKQSENGNHQSDANSESTKKQNHKKQTLFMVPSVALAIQQGLTLRANLPHLHVQTACFASSSSRRARATLGTCDVIVTTHGVIQDLLMHYGDTFRMDRFNLVVIDECHYAGSGNHAYRHLMNKFYHSIEERKRPRVLGLTASPLLNVRETHSDEQLSTMLENLEKTLDAKMVTAAALTSSSGGFLNRVIDERTFNFRGANVNRSIPQADNLDLLPSRYREFKQLEQLYKDLGPLVTSIYCSVLQRELSRNSFENESGLRFDRAVEHLKRIEEFCNHEIKFLPNMGRNGKVLALEELIETLIEERGGAKTIGLVFVERRITAIALECYFVWRNQKILDGVSSGVRTGWQFAREVRQQTSRADTIFQLSGNKGDQRDDKDEQFDDSIDDPFHIFQQRKESQEEMAVYTMDEPSEKHGDEFQTMQFMDAESDSEDEVEDSARRSSAKDSFRRLGRVVVKPVALVRNPAHIFNSLSLVQKKLKESEKEEKREKWVHKELNVREVLNKLRRGDMNLMFATSVVEEGVDVQACSFVVALDGLTNVKGYIQMKGRARKQDAKFFVFRDPNDSTGSKLELSVAQKMEHRVQTFIEERMRINAPNFQDISFHNEWHSDATTLPKEIAAVEARVYRVGDATVDVQSAKSLLNRYFLSIPLDPFVRSKKESLLAYMPCFESNRLVLPLHLPSDMRNVVLPPKYDNFPRREKQKLLSLMACVRLHSRGLLNDRLLPLSRKDMQSRVMEVAMQKLEKIKPVPLNLSSFYNHKRRHFVVYKINQEGELLSKYSDSLNGGGHTLGLIAMSPIKSIDPLRLYHANFGKVDISLGESVSMSCSEEEFDMLQKVFVLLTNSRWSRKSKNLFYEMRTKEQYDAVIPPYLVGILSQCGDLDWNVMTQLVAESNRSIEERAFTESSLSSSEEVPKPRICCTSYNEFVPYVIFGPTGESCEAEMTYGEVATTYRDYYKKVHSFELPHECPLFRAHRIWSLDSGLPTKPRSKGKSKESLSLDACKIPDQALIEEPLANAHVALLCLFLPQVLFLVERQQKTEAFIRHCEVHIPTLGKCFRKMEFSRVAVAVTSKSCNSDENYDVWEWVGDAVLKLLQTDSILKSKKFKHFVKFLHEGDLSMLRSAMGTNERLRQICTHLCLENYIMMTPLARGKWIPSPLQLDQAPNANIKTENTQRIKVLADVIESILGVIYLEFGYHTSMKVGNELHVTFPWDETDTSVACGEEGYIDNSELVDIVQKCTGHSKAFFRPKLLSEAFTHPSAIDASVPSYQRLEWIGDAVLCLCAREWLFRHMGETNCLGDLVVYESAIVSNETLGFLSMRFGLQEYLNHRDQSLPKRIESYCWNIQEGCGFWGGDPPKPIADMVEAMLGAIHIDGGFESGQEATRRLMSPIFSVFTHASSKGPSGLNTFLKTMKHPKKALQEMTGQLVEVMACSEHDFVSSYDNDDEDEQDDSTTSYSLPKILHKDEWRNPARGVERGGDGCQIAFVSILGRPLVVVADESNTVARNRASSLVREAIERRKDIERRMAECRSNVESGLTFANSAP